MIRLALIGYGVWGRNYHRTIDSIRGVEISFICRLRPGLTSPGIARSVRVTASLDEALEDADAVIIATPPSTHREIACRCLGSGLPVMLEKPVALSVEDAEAVFAASRASGAPVLVDNIHLFSPAFETLRSMTSSWGPVMIASEGGGHGPFRDYPALFDWGPHDVSMALGIFRASPGSASVRTVPEACGDIHEIRLSAGASSAVLRVGSGFPDKRRRFEIRCGDRSAVYDDCAQDKLIMDGRPVRIHDELPLHRALLTFKRCVESGTVDWRFSHGLNLDVMSVLTQ